MLCLRHGGEAGSQSSQLGPSRAATMRDPSRLLPGEVLPVMVICWAPGSPLTALLSEILGLRAPESLCPAPPPNQGSEISLSSLSSQRALLRT